MLREILLCLKTGGEWKWKGREGLLAFVDSMEDGGK